MGKHIADFNLQLQNEKRERRHRTLIHVHMLIFSHNFSLDKLFLCSDDNDDEVKAAGFINPICHIREAHEWMQLTKEAPTG